MQLLTRPTLAALAAAAFVTSGGPHLAGLRPAPVFAEQGTRGAIDAQGRAPAVAAAQNSPSAIDLRVETPRVTSRVYLDVSIGNAPAGRLVIDLFGEACPRAAENFRALCSGETGFGYAGSSFYRIVQGLTVQGGGIAGSPGGAPGQSIFGPTFAHDNYYILHNLPGIVSMVNAGVGGGSGLSDSRFLIQLPADAGFLDGRYEAFGRVSDGLDVLTKIDRVPTAGSKNRPTVPITIDAAGLL